jgi:hypothetical protein
MIPPELKWIAPGVVETDSTAGGAAGVSGATADGGRLTRSTACAASKELVARPILAALLLIYHDLHNGAGKPAYSPKIDLSKPQFLRLDRPRLSPYMESLFAKSESDSMKSIKLRIPDYEGWRTMRGRPTRIWRLAYVAALLILPLVARG